ncbi:cytochrome c oxidase assembly protein [Xanthobacter dioxanivorans]|uniref:Cytochrome c oxidase assembly protein CtaG n=1 Tax=Xanthobacter dioxanivorans TaxID=2528964 RepID=A0A974SIB3_9HYPH|nr:cytochrome c oxidase assembly protein [Xanthobacter dioxanivorans]QRG06009.1 cytochrome c oxidase assembly protein [Xanthobacter dioxanivorans]
MTDAKEERVPQRATGRRHLAVAWACVAFIAAMAGVTYASVPLYAMFCSLTGFGGSTRVGQAAPASSIEREMTISFDANVAPGLPWAFAPSQREMTVKVGATSLAHFTAKNRASAETHGNATYNVSPPQAGAYFVKMQCFCFDEQVLAPGETMDMPVVFYVDPAIEKDPDLKTLSTITLSYTFFPAKAPSERAALEKAADKPVVRAN